MSSNYRRKFIEDNAEMANVSIQRSVFVAKDLRMYILVNQDVEINKGK